MRKADSVILLDFKCSMNPQNLIKIIGAIFEKIKILFIFLCELPLTLLVPRAWEIGYTLPCILRVVRKQKRETGNIRKGTADIEFEEDLSVGLGATLRDRQNIKKLFFYFQGFFRDKPIVSYCCASNILQTHKI